MPKPIERDQIEFQISRSKEVIIDDSKAKALIPHRIFTNQIPIPSDRNVIFTFVCSECGVRFKYYNHVPGTLPCSHGICDGCLDMHVEGMGPNLSNWKYYCLICMKPFFKLDLVVYDRLVRDVPTPNHFTNVFEILGGVRKCGNYLILDSLKETANDDRIQMSIYGESSHDNDVIVFSSQNRAMIRIRVRFQCPVCLLTNIYTSKFPIPSACGHVICTMCYNQLELNPEQPEDICQVCRATNFTQRIVTFSPNDINHVTQYDGPNDTAQCDDDDDDDMDDDDMQKGNEKLDGTWRLAKHMNEKLIVFRNNYAVSQYTKVWVQLSTIVKYMKLKTKATPSSHIGSDLAVIERQRRRFMTASDHQLYNKYPTIYTVAAEQCERYINGGELEAFGFNELKVYGYYKFIHLIYKLKKLPLVVYKILMGNRTFVDPAIRTFKPDTVDYVYIRDRKIYLDTALSNETLEFIRALPKEELFAVSFSTGAICNRVLIPKAIRYYSEITSEQCVEDEFIIHLNGDTTVTHDKDVRHVSSEWMMIEAGTKKDMSENTVHIVFRVIPQLNETVKMNNQFCSVPDAMTIDEAIWISPSTLMGARHKPNRYLFCKPIDEHEEDSKIAVGDYVVYVGNESIEAAIMNPYSTVIRVSNVISSSDDAPSMMSIGGKIVKYYLGYLIVHYERYGIETYEMMRYFEQYRHKKFMDVSEYYKCVSEIKNRFTYTFLLFSYQSIHHRCVDYSKFHNVGYSCH